MVRRMTRQTARNASPILPRTCLSKSPALTFTTSRRTMILTITNPAIFFPTLLLKLHLGWQICAVGATFLLLYQVFGVWRGPDLTSSGLFALFRHAYAPSQFILLGINSAIAALILFELLTMGAALPAFDGVFGGSYSFAASIWIWIIWPIVAVLVIWKMPSLNTPLIRRIVLGTLAVLLIWHLLNLFKGNPFATASRLSRFGDLFTGAPLIGFFTSVWVFLAYAIFTKFIWRLVAKWIPWNFLSAAVFILILFGGGCLQFWTIHGRLRHANDLPFFYRISHLTSGVSPMVPILFLLIGFYLWTWQALAGNTLLCFGHPLLPTLPALRHRVSSEMGKRIIRVAKPLYLGLQVTTLPLCLLILAVAYIVSLGPPLLSLEGRIYDYALNLALLFAFLITTAEASRLFFTWKELQRMLTALSRLRLRRTFARLRAIDSSSLWSVSGNVQRVQFHFFSQQLDAVNRLYNLSGKKSPALETATVLGGYFSVNSADKIKTGPRWEKTVFPKAIEPRVYIREEFNNAVSEVMNSLEAYWAEEKESLCLDISPSRVRDGDGAHDSFEMELPTDPAVRAAEEFVCFHYIAFIQNILARMRTMILSMMFLFVSVCFAISFYPFVPRTGISMWMMVNLFLIAAVVVYVYAGMERDATLSYITNTRPGDLGTEFYIKTATFLAGPVIGLLTTQFPAISESVLGWLQPGLDALK